MNNQNNVIRKHGQHTYPKKKIVCIVSNTAKLHDIEVGFFAEEILIKCRLAVSETAFFVSRVQE